MFIPNNKYLIADFSHNDEIRGKDVMIYPENKLSPILVTSDFGDCEVVTSDLYDLFNQNRIQNLGIDVVRDFIARNYPSTSQVSEAISKMSDEEIMDSIKPRNIQSYSELMLWSKYLNSQIQDKIDKANVSDVSDDSSVDSSSSSSVDNSSSE